MGKRKLSIKNFKFNNQTTATNKNNHISPTQSSSSKNKQRSKERRYTNLKVSRTDIGRYERAVSSDLTTKRCSVSHLRLSASSVVLLCESKKMTLDTYDLIDTCNSRPWYGHLSRQRTASLASFSVW